MQSLSRNRKRLLESDLGQFLRLYGRRAQKGVEPNDRPYDRNVERMIQRLNPKDLDLLLRGEADEQ